MELSLSALAQYKNERVIQSFLKTWALPQAEAEDLFEETKKWLWLCARLEHLSPDGQRLAITESTKLMDEMWHNFVLTTRDYRQFCEQYLGVFIEHQPTTEQEHQTRQQEHDADPQAFIEQQKNLLRWQYAQVMQHLGEDTLIKWYDTWAERYTDQFLLKIWRWSFSAWGSPLAEKVSLSLDGQILTARRTTETRTAETIITPLSAEQIVQAWQDPQYRASLPPAQLAQLPTHPAGDPARYASL